MRKMLNLHKHPKLTNCVSQEKKQKKSSVSIFHSITIQSNKPNLQVVNLNRNKRREQKLKFEH